MFLYAPRSCPQQRNKHTTPKLAPTLSCTRQGVPKDKVLNMYMGILYILLLIDR